MKFKHLAVALATGALAVLSTHVAEAQAITSDPIQTVPGYQGCGGNSSQQDVTSTVVCANQRTFHFGAADRTVVAVSTMNPDGTASTTFTLTGGTAPADVPLAVRAWSGISSGGTLYSAVSGTIPQGTAGPVTLNYTFDCGQVDVKAVFTSTSNGNGRISGGLFCKPMTAPTTAPTTAPGTTTAPPTTAPVSSVSPTTVSGAPGASVQPQTAATLPATGRDNSTAVRWGLFALVLGSACLIIGLGRKSRA